MNKVNWGIIGLGNIAHSFSEGFNDVENSNLLGISSLNSEKLETFKSKFNIDAKYVYNNYEQLIACKDIDIVYITLPNSYHYKWILKCFENNKRVLVEKPAFLNFKDAQNVKKKIDEKNIFFSEGFMYRYHPQIKEILKVIENNEIGKIISMDSSFGANLLTKKKFFFFNKKKKINTKGRLFNKDLGGGCILDLGCYTSSFSFLIASKIKDINFKNFKIKEIKKEIGPTGVEINAEAIIEFEKGFYSKIKSSFKNNIGSKSTIYGDKGSLTINNTWHGGGIKKLIGNEVFEVQKENHKNIFSLEIENISETILNKSNYLNFQGVDIEETLINSKLLEEWLGA